MGTRNSADYLDGSTSALHDPCMEARLRLLQILREMESREGTPWNLLRKDVLPAYLAKKGPMSLAGGDGARASYVQFCEERDRRSTAFESCLEDWAINCKFVELNDQQQLTPAAWMIKLATYECNKWSEQPAATLQWWKQIREVEKRPTTVQEAEYITFAVAGGERRSPGETVAEYKKRVRRSLNDYLNQRCRETHEDFGSPSSFSGARARSRPVRKRDRLEHYRWLALYQCCGWTETKIGKRYHRTQQTVSEGVRLAAHNVGLCMVSQTPHRKSGRKLAC